MARGIGILLVVAFHCAFGLQTAGLMADTALTRGLHYVVYTFHVPLFFLLSGLFVRAALDRGAGVFWRGRLAGIAWPYLLWMSVHLGLMGAFAAVTNHGAARGFDTIGADVYLWRPIAPYWFLHALWWCNCAFFALRRLPDAALAALAALLFAASLAVPGTAAHDAAWGFLLFALGALARPLLPAARGRSSVLTRALDHPAAPPLLAAVTAALALGGLALGVSFKAALPAALCGIAATLAAARRLAARPGAPAARALALCGRASLAIFSLHVLGTAALRIGLWSGAGVTSVPVHLALGTLAGVLLPLAAWAAAGRLGLSGWLALPGAPRSAGPRPPRSRGGLSPAGLRAG